MATILLLSGPNLNLLGEREPEIYGTDTLDDCVGDARAAAEAHGHDARAPAVEPRGRARRRDPRARGRAAPRIVINPGAFTHSSYALADALAAFDGVKVELHLSNPSAREEWRRTSVVAPYVTGTIAGFGRTGYRLASTRSDAGRAPSGGEAATMSGADDARPALPAMDVAGAARPRCASASTTPASTRCSSPACRTCATSPGFTGIGRARARHRGRRAARHRRSLPRAGGRAARGGGRRRPRRDRRHAGRAARGRCGRVADPGSAGSGSRRTASPGRSSARSPTSGSPASSCVATERPRRGLRRGEGPGRGRPDPSGVRDRRRRARRRCCPTLAEAPTERDFALALEFAMRERGATRRQLRPDRRVGPERREAARPARPTGRSGRASSSSSTSAASSTGTAPT